MKRILILSMFVLISQSKSSDDFSCSDVGVYQVSNSSRDEPECLNQGNSSEPCGTLSYLVSNISECAEFVILDAVLNLNDVVEFNNLYNVTVKSVHEFVDVRCKGNVGFIIQNCTDIFLVNLHFQDCQIDIFPYLNPPWIQYSLWSNLSTVFFIASQDVRVLNCSFTSHIGSAILLVNVAGLISFEGTTFTGNESAVCSQYPRSGGIVLRNYPSFNCNSTVQVISCRFNANFNSIPELSGSNCNSSGGAIDMQVASLVAVHVSFMIFKSNFSQNYACRGGAIRFSVYGKQSYLEAVVKKSIFSNNRAFFSGGAIVFSSYEEVVGNYSYPLDELDSYGKLLVKDSKFIENHAEWGGALGVYCVSCEGCNSTISVYIIGSEWKNNTATSSGFAIGLSGLIDPKKQRSCSINLSVGDNCTFYGNSFSSDFEEVGVGAISVQSAYITFENVTTIVESNNGSALLLRGTSQANFYGEVVFKSNVGILGGAILIQSDSGIFIGLHSNISFIDNKAFIYGGAIYSDVDDYYCAIEFDSQIFPNITNVHFVHNIVNGRNQSVFIRASKPCEKQKDLILYGFNYTPPDAFQVIFPVDKVVLKIFPVPPKGALLELMLGEPFYLEPVKLMDMFNTSSTGIGYMYYQQLNNLNIPLVVVGPHTVGFDQFMGTINFSVSGPLVTGNITLNISFFFQKQSSYHVGSNTVSVIVRPCRLGYTHSASSNTCICASTDKIKCPADGRQICLKYHYWYSKKTNSAYPCPTAFCEYQNQHCPSEIQVCFNSTGYCSIAESSDVCWKGRDGVLCSECKKGFSFTIGAFKCVNSTMTCSPKNTALVMMLLLIYWTAFSVVLLVVLSLQLSIGSGFMYGIIYYFSVVTLYTGDNSLFSDSWISYVLYVCVALTQLDCYALTAIIMPYCFAHSWKTTLPHIIFQYLGPFFVVSLITAVILVSSYCRLPKHLRLSHSSPIHAICMLVLISYTSVSHTSFQLLLPTFVEESWRIKWAPSTGYLSLEHIPYALVAIVLELVLSIPICMFLLCAPRISKHIDLVKYKLKPIVDEFQACYRPECRWFAGFYFLARQLVYFTNGVFSETVPQANVPLVLLNVIVWAIHCSLQPYQKTWLNVLDTILLTDLVLLSSSSVVEQNLDLENKVNIFFHQNALPYILILVPVCYLIGSVLVIFGQKLLCRKICFSKVWSAFYLKRRYSNNVSSGYDQDKDECKVSNKDLYYRDDGVREPLIEEDSITGKRSINSNYGGMRDVSNQQQNSQDFTSSSFRVAGLSSFPPDLHKAAASDY